MAVRARPAASLLAVWRDNQGAPHVFMGRRHPDLRFLPNCLVFPGGRVEQRDRIVADTPLSAACLEALNTELRDDSAGAYGVAALRECAEETGLALSGDKRGPLRYIARAITPPHLPLRYDTRFFLCEVLGATAPTPQAAGDGELLNVGWYALDGLANETLHQVTQAVLDHAVDGLRANTTPPRRMLVADRTPKRWHGLPALTSAQLKAANS